MNEYTIGSVTFNPAPHAAAPACPAPGFMQTVTVGGQNYIDPLQQAEELTRLRGENERLQSELAALRRPVADDEALAVIVKDLRELQQPWRDVDVDDRNALTSKWRGLLRRTVAQSDEIERIRHEVTITSRHCAAGVVRVHQAETLLRALDAAQRETQQLIANHEKREDQMEAEIARLSTPPEEQREISDRRRNGYASGCDPQQESNASIAIRRLFLAMGDIDTLLQDAARYRNALAVAQINHAGELEQRDERIAGVMGERDAAREKCELLEMLMEAMRDCIVDEGSDLSFEARAEELIVTEVNHENALQRIERLEGALRLARIYCIHGICPECEYPLQHAPVKALLDDINTALAAADGQQPSGYCSAHNGPYPRDCNVCFPADRQKAEG